VDITFPEQESLIDVVYGFFEANITTHFDCDQQIWRVRHPGAVKVWLNPRRFCFDTSPEVVKRDIQQNHLFKNVLSDYDDDLTPQYHTNDPLIDMAVLARSQELMSKNNLKRNYIALKKRNGHAIQFVDRDQTIGSEGALLQAQGQIVAEGKYRDQIRNAKILTKEEFDELQYRIEANEAISANERFALERTRIEKFYRRPISDELFEVDDRGRFRLKIVRFEHLVQHATTGRDRDSQTPLSNEYAFRLRFIRDHREIARLQHELLTLSGVYSDGQFDTTSSYSAITLEPLMRRANQIKGVIENLLQIEVRKGIGAGVKQLGSMLDFIGLEQQAAGATKAKAVAGGKKIYSYRICERRLRSVEAIVQRRQQIGDWDFIKSQYALSWEGE
jgi:hypothetical protein